MDDLVSRLQQLDANPEPAAVRFDAARAVCRAVLRLFNPPTLAHKHLLESARAIRELANPPSPATEGSRERGPGSEGLIALLTTKNVDKGLHGASLADRIGMLLALESELPGLAVVASNQARIIDQAEALTRSFAGLESLAFVVGFDTLERLFARRTTRTWKRR